MDIPDSSWGEKCQDNINYFPLCITDNALLQQPVFPLWQSVLYAEMARNPKWCWQTPKHSEIWIILKIYKLSLVYIFKRLLVFPHFYITFHACSVPDFTSGKTSTPSLSWTESILNHTVSMISHPWHWMPLLWGIQLLSGILLSSVFECSVERKT